MLVVGDREAEEGNVAVRRHHEGDIGTVTVERFAEHVLARAGRSPRRALDGLRTRLYFRLLTLTSAHPRA